MIRISYKALYQERKHKKSTELVIKEAHCSYSAIFAEKYMYNLVCRRCTNWANYRNFKATWQKFGGILCLLWRMIRESKGKFCSLKSKMLFIWNRVNNQILGVFIFRFKFSKKKKYLYMEYITSGERLTEEFQLLCLRGYFSEKMAEQLRMQWS